jgi:hypothetical protein
MTTKRPSCYVVRVPRSGHYDRMIECTTLAEARSTAATYHGATVHRAYGSRSDRYIDARAI